MQHYQERAIGILGCLIGLAMASAALAQAPRSRVDMAAAQGVPEFRDPKTGQIWTPNNVGHDNGPPARDPADLAFDPQHQTAYVEGVVVQRPAVVVLDTVPITAGPTVPIIKIDDAQLRAVPGKRWEVVLYLDNNSGNYRGAGSQLPLYQQRQVGRLNGRAGASGRRRHPRRHDYRRPQDRNFR
jgi:hypothetical protein